jgi:hypothetical protein
MNFPIGYGHEVKPQQPAAEPQAQEPAAEPLTASQSGLTGSAKRKRARVTGGRFAADDPATMADEAWVES